LVKEGLAITSDICFTVINLELMSLAGCSAGSGKNIVVAVTATNKSAPKTSAPCKTRAGLKVRGSLVFLNNVTSLFALLAKDVFN